MFSRLGGSRWPRTSPIRAACQIITARYAQVSFHSDYKSVVVLRHPMHFCPTAHGEKMMMNVGSGCVWPLESGVSRCHEVIAIICPSRSSVSALSQSEVSNVISWTFPFDVVEVMFMTSVFKCLKHKADSCNSLINHREKYWLTWRLEGGQNFRKPLGKAAKGS